MSNAIGVDACANLLRDYIDEIILEILGDARDQSHANRRSEQQSYTSDEIAGSNTRDSESRRSR